MSSADQWRWTDDDGVQRLLSGEELRAALRDGRLKPTTLVWRRGMKNWCPAGQVEDLMIDEETVETVTQDHPTNRKPPGIQRAPTPSIPVPSGRSGATPRPSNMVDIAALRAQQNPRGRPNTMHGLGDPTKRGSGNPVPADQNVRVPMAPRVPQLGYRGGDADQAAAVLAGPPPDGGWKDGAARGDEEETVTTLRGDQDDSTLSDREKRKSALAKPQLRERKRSIPPPRKRSVPPPARMGSRPPGPGVVTGGAAARTMVSPEQRPRRDSAVPEAVPSTAVLSEAFPSGVGKHQRAHAQMVADPLALEETSSEGSFSVKPVATAPLPAVRPDTPSRPDPKFASEPWQRARVATPQPVSAPQPISTPPPSGPIPHAVHPSGAPISQRPMGMQSTIPTVVPPRKGAVTLQLPILVGASGVLLALFLGSFFAGRWSATALGGMSGAVEARSGWTAVPLFARMTSRAGASQRPCLMLRAPSRYVPNANNRVPVEVLPTDGGKLAVGYAAGPREPRGMMVDPNRGLAEMVYEPGDLDEALSRVVPVNKDGEVSFAPTVVEKDGVTNAITVPSKPSFVIGFQDKALVRMPEPGAEAAPIWDLDPPGKIGDALSASAMGDGRIAVGYRYAGRIWYGIVKSDGAVVSAAKPVIGSPEGVVGKPYLSSNGNDVSVVFADRPNAPGAVAEIRWARTNKGEMPSDAAALELPPGGPGGEAIAPAVAALSGGRWLLMWTEGSVGNRVLRAQTYDRKYRPLGEALRVSPETGSFGQGTLGVVGETAAVVFFLATTGTYEIWGTVLQCE